MAPFPLWQARVSLIFPAVQINIKLIHYFKVFLIPHSQH